MITPRQVVCRLATVSFIYFASTDSITFASASSTTTSAGTSNQSAGKLRSLGETAMMERRFDEAASYYQKAIEVEPDNAANYYKLFRVHSRMRKYVSALKDITQACEVDQSNKTEYRFQKAKLLVNLGQCEEAVQEYHVLSRPGMEALSEEIIQSRDDADHCAHYTRMATEAHADGNWEVAVVEFTTAMSYMDQNYDYLFMKAEAEFNSGDYYGTVSDTGKILKAHSKHIEAYELRGKAYFRLGEHDTAVQHFREGLKLDPEHKGCKAQHKAIKALLKKEKRGDDAEKSGKMKEAIDYWWEAIHLDRSHRAFIRPVLLKIGKAHSELKQHEEATRVIQEHVDEEKTLEGLFALGDALTAAEDFQQAVNIFREATDFEPNDKQQECRQRLQKAEIALKQSKEKNYYKILGVSRTADKKAIKKAYKEKALQWHPDKAEDKEKGEKMFQDISEAYEVLSDPELKGKYDRGEEVFENQGGGGGGRQHHGFPQEFFRHAGGGRQGGGQHHFRFH